jgi:hypothetical protein
MHNGAQRNHAFIPQDERIATTLSALSNSALVKTPGNNPATDFAIAKNY